MAKSKIRLGLVWHTDGHEKEVTKMFKNGKCQITETWIAEDTGKECRHVSNQIIIEDSEGREYCYDPKYEEYAKPDDDENYSWWARKYACGADNYTETDDDEAFRQRMIDIEAEQAQQEIDSMRIERDEWDDLWDDRARSCGAIRL